MRAYIITLIMAVSFLAATNVRAAGVVPLFYQTPEEYLNVAGPSNWVFGNFDTNGERQDNGVRSLVYGFEVRNVVTKDVVDATFIAKGMNGWGGELNVASSGSTVSLSHNTAHEGIMIFYISLDQLISANFIDSFFIQVAPHDASNGYLLGVTAVASNGERLLVQQNTADGGFFGFTLADGYFTEIIISINGGKPNGGFDSITVGFGNGVPPPRDEGGAAVPEPATLAVLGLGLAGLGLARARQKKRM